MLVQKWGLDLNGQFAICSSNRWTRPARELVNHLEAPGLEEGPHSFLELGRPVHRHGMAGAFHHQQAGVGNRGLSEGLLSGGSKVFAPLLRLTC
jgi:hypothetical protein